MPTGWFTDKARNVKLPDGLVAAFESVKYRLITIVDWSKNDADEITAIRTAIPLQSNIWYMLLNTNDECKLIVTVVNYPRSWTKNTEAQAIGDEGDIYYDFDQSIDIGQVKQNNPVHWFKNIVQKATIDQQHANSSAVQKLQKTIIQSQTQEQKTRETLAKLQEELVAIKNAAEQSQKQQESIIKKQSRLIITLQHQNKTENNTKVDKIERKCKDCDDSTPGPRFIRCAVCRAALKCIINAKSYKMKSKMINFASKSKRPKRKLKTNTNETPK